MKIIRIYINFLVLALPLLSFSQHIDNIHFEQIGKQIHIYYDLEGSDTYTVQVFCSTNNEQSWGEPLKHVTGAVGENQIPGKDKIIVWDVLQEREKLSGIIKFKVDGVQKKITKNRYGNYYYATERFLQSYELEDLSDWELKIMRNEIFARYGFVFKTKSMREYFNNQNWYKNMVKKSPDDNCAAYLSSIEKANIKLILSIEKDRASN